MRVVDPTGAVGLMGVVDSIGIRLCEHECERKGRVRREEDE